MKKLISLSAQAGLLILTLAMPGRTDAISNTAQERFKSSINTMVQQVKSAENPSDKREIIGKFLLRVDQGMARVETLQPLTKNDRITVASLRTRIQSQYNDLNGFKGHDKVADSDLNSYAGYVQQDMEQADGYWGGGGVYISCGTLLLIIIIILLLR